MSEKPKSFAAPSSKAVKTKRPSTVSVDTFSRGKTTKEKNVATLRSKFKNTTVVGDCDVSILKSEASAPDFDSVSRDIEYGKFLRAMLVDDLVNEKMERQETQMDIQMSQLADRFQKTMDVLDRTNRRLKDIHFTVEQKRLLDLKNRDCAQFYDTTEKSNAEALLKDLMRTEQSCLDKLHMKNIDFGYDKESGHKQLLDAVNDAIDGLEQIKKHSNLDIDKFKEYEKSEKKIHELEQKRLSLESFKTEFGVKFTDLNEKLLKDVSEKIAGVMDD